MKETLFAVYLGGYAPHCHVELHDMVFVVGETIEATFPQLIHKWFIKEYHQFHYDGYRDLRVVDGHRVTLCTEPSASDQKLFYVHLGGYDPAEFTELHKNCFLVAPDKTTAKSRARASWGTVKVPHKDIQFDVESCLHIDAVEQLHIHLAPTHDAPDTDLHLGYHLIPTEVVAQSLNNEATRG
jgi:hypothetical protein